MSFKSQESNMRKLAHLLEHDLSYIWGDHESGPNGDKKVFLNTGKTFLRALAKDLGLHQSKVYANASGIGESGECCLSGMWESNGIYIRIGQFPTMGEQVVLYRTIRKVRDYKGGYNQYLRRSDLLCTSYPALLNVLVRLRKEDSYVRAA